MNVPKIRFNGFEEEWQENKLCDIARITMGQSPNSENYTNNSNDTLLIQGNADLNNGKVIPRLFTKQVTKTCDKNDIIMTVRAPVGDIAISDYNACIGRGVCSIKSSKFVYHYLDYLKMQDYWKKVSKGSTIDSITSDDIKSLLIKIPNKKEEEKIIKTIDLINKIIELQTKKIENLKLFKKGLLYKEFNDKQKNKKLSDCFKFGKAGGTPKSTVKEYYDGSIPFLSISDMTSQGKYLERTEKSISELGLNSSSAWLVPSNSLIISMYASYGLVSINKIDLATSQAMFDMIIKDEDNNEYIYYYLYYLYITNYYDSIVSTGTQPNLNAEQLKNLFLYMPSREEQLKISKKFITFDKKINLETNKLIKLVELKKGLMQSMFV